MPYLDSVEELLEAKEGEHALWRMMAVASWCLVSRIKDPAVWWEAVPLNSQSAPAWG